ncbi:hypothetical protein BAUCODRAFT_21618 [Baudoinia panamericana UAMH 10762]|uniref:FAD dependent oxidoreductase domain-containing protein n=1 Tax=Baudoinia panamericana (strain UAMH 10762) TaxID=717646 RepID=M2MSS4_BAUPA|nr:uncharacterized protein BAUCODRAFT_21618 [Baudoinia panamericana UAMH 10762]EMC99926.1 hypothetical protein BAUCODRAFT_21618 [Baudoinia panamericana UAMH 10762]
MSRPEDPSCPPAPPVPPLPRPEDWEEPEGWPLQRDVNHHNDWTRNTSIKTAKCDVCSERITNYSWECEECGKRICSECAEYEYGNSEPQYRFIAKDNLDNKCGCFYQERGGQAPYLRRHMLSLDIIKQPPQRIEEDLKNRQEKAIIKERKKRKAEAIARGEKPEPYTPKKSRKAKLATNDELFPARKLAKQKAKQVPEELADYTHLEGGTTVIVGAGIVGLSIARELATKASENNIQHRVVVVDIRSSYCELASGSCAGLLTVDGLPEELDSLVELAQPAWEELYSTAGFPQATDMVGGNALLVSQEGGKGTDNGPSWYVQDESEVIAKDNWSMGTMFSNTVKLGQWLFNECQQLGVKFHFDRYVCSTTRLSDRDVTSVYICEAANDQMRTNVKCQNLVLANGPWASKVFSGVASKSTVKLKNNTTTAHWIRLGSGKLHDGDRVGLLLPSLAANSSVLHDKITMICHSHDAEATEIILASVDKQSHDRILFRQEALDHNLNGGKTDLGLRYLQQLAASKISTGGKELSLSDSMTAGSSLVSTANNQVPIIDKVRKSGLGRVGTVEEDDQRCGVWLCYGFGMHGTTLAPAAAKVLSRRIFGEPTEIDDSKFAIPEYELPVAEMA